MNFTDCLIRRTKEYADILKTLKDGVSPVGLSGVCRASKSHIISALPDDLHRRAVVIVADEGAAIKLKEDLQLLGRQSVIFETRDLSLRQSAGVSHEFERLRAGVLSKIVSDKTVTLIATPDALCTYTIPPEHLEKVCKTLKVGDEIEQADLLKMLVTGGYICTDSVESAGQFAHRGGIIDIFAPDSEKPFRIEFWGDEIDSISVFDVATQRRTDSVEEIIITPAREIIYPDADAFYEKLRTLADKTDDKTAKQIILKDADGVRSGIFPTNFDKYVSLCFDRLCTIFDYLDNSVFFIDDQNRVFERMKSFYTINSELVTSLLEEHILTKQLNDFYIEQAEFISKITSSVCVALDSFTVKSDKIRFKNAVILKSRSLPEVKGTAKEIADELAPLLSSGYKVILACGTEKTAKAFYELFTDNSVPAVYSENPNNVPEGTLFVTPNALSSGVEYTSIKTAIYTNARTSVKRERRRKYGLRGATIGSLEELKKGDYVVHSVYGIGVFDGIHKIEKDGIEKDYIKIKYLRDEILYVPVTQLDIVSKYIGTNDDGNVKIDKLGSDRWQKTKSRVKAAVKDMADELIKLYAERSKSKGYAFSEDIDLQHDFEYRFPYDETDDQLKCCDEIKKDMQQPRPMDRLLCGDVGFGKTEVALRAAFKCILDGKQCAILVPTTILALQHYRTILERMEGFAVNVEMISRFRTASQQTEIKRKLKEGNIDIIVGTHRIISKDIEFRDLGLLIVDEEQRFGVAQKEKIKQKFPDIDVLTLSATPIPRTLNMAMSGIRDMSVIEEAPTDRHPVQTYVIEHDEEVLFDAMRKEVYRGGQVYYIYNSIETINSVANRISNAIPDATVAVAHGRMTEKELSDIWRSMLENEIDILVCTTIIETGVDVSNANTLIIENADRFGLSQLHQLRGRVGRSSRRAYAYFTFRRGKALSEIAQKRLSAVREFTEFGSGFKIAMRDLEIRGAGNILGANQHGHLEAVGYDMYVRMLSDAIKEKKGERVQPLAECTVDLQIKAHIPEEYIPSTSDRLNIYRRIAQIKTKEDSLDVMDELIDRYGEPPSAVTGLVDIAFLRNRAITLGIKEVSERQGVLLIFFAVFDIEVASALVSALRGRVLISAGNKPYVSVRFKDKSQTRQQLLTEIFDALDSYFATKEQENEKNGEDETCG